MQFLAQVYVTLKPTVNDPQGIAVLGGLRNLGFEPVTGVRVGKYLEVTLDASSADDAEAAVQEMCRRLLANTVIEQFRFTVAEVSAGESASSGGGPRPRPSPGRPARRGEATGRRPGPVI